MPKNKYERNVKNSNPLAPNSVTFPGDGGLFGANPAPGLRDYPETRGNVLPPTKFQDTDIAPSTSTKKNPMKREVSTPNLAEVMGLQQPGTTRIVKGRNRYENSSYKNTADKVLKKG